MSQLKWFPVEIKPDKDQEVLCIQNPNTTATRKVLFAIFDGENFIPLSKTTDKAINAKSIIWTDIILWSPKPITPPYLIKEYTPVNVELNNIFHKLWTKATTTKDYNKKEWKELVHILSENGIIV